MTTVVYNNFFEGLFNGDFDFTSDDIRVMLTTSSYSPDVDTHVNRSDVTNEVSGTGYTTGGQALTSISVTLDNTNDAAYVDSTDPAWAASSITARYAVFYQYNGSAATDVLIGYQDLTSNQTSDASTFTLVLDANGFLRVRTMSTATNVYYSNTFYRDLLSGVHDFTNDTHKMALLTSSHTPDIDTDEHLDDVNANEVSGTGYTAGGITLAGNTVAQDNTNDRATLDYTTDPTFSTVTLTARYAAIYRSTGAAATDDIIAVLDFGSDKTATAADFVLTVNAAGIFNANNYA